MTTIIFLIVLAVLIFVHELGHFLAARLCGIRVDAFALGFGPKIISKKVGETTYALNLIPFGGYVKIFGENPDDDSIHGPDMNRSLVHKPKWQQALVLIAGIFFNFLFAWILVSAAFMFGVPAATSSYPQYEDRMKDSHIVITYVNPQSPAERAGLKAGDTLTGFPSLESLQKAIDESALKGISLTYMRSEQVNSTTIIAEKGIVEGKYAIGIAMDTVATLKLPIHRAIFEAMKFTVHTIDATYSGLKDLIVTAVQGKAHLSSISGPVGIAGLIGDAARLGFNYLIMFTAIISINLGVLNLVPFPALDGGRLLFVLIEAIIRRKIQPVIANTINTIGFALLLLLMVIVTFQDITKLFK